MNIECDIAGTADETQKFRTHIGQISRQSGVFFAGTMFTAAASYLFKVYLARALGAETLGIYALGMTIIGLVGVFNGLGLSQSAVRFVPLYTATGKYAELRGFILLALVLLLGANVLLGTAVLVGGPWIAEHVYHTPELTRYLKYFALIMLFGALTTFFGRVLQGYRDVSKRTVITSFVGIPLMMSIAVGLVAAGAGLRGYLLAQVLSAVVVLVLLMAWAWRLTPRPARHLTGSLRKLERQVLSFGVAVFGIALLEFLLAQVDKILIGFYINAREVGVYAVAMTIVAFVPIGLQSVNQIFSPTIADLHARGERELLKRLYQTLTKWIIAFTLPLATVVIVFAKPLMRIFGSEFEAGWVILVVGTLGQLINCATGSVGYLLLMSGNQKRLIKVQTVMTAVIILLNVFLIPRWGILGAAVAAAVTTVLSNCWYLYEVRRALGFSPYNRGYLGLLLPMFAAVIVACLLRFTLATTLPDWARVFIGFALCYATLIGAGSKLGLDGDDRLIARAVWSKVREGFGKVRASEV